MSEQCPACGQADLTPYGNGSKWICPRCHFLLPCCEGGELSCSAVQASDFVSAVVAEAGHFHDHPGHEVETGAASLLP